MPSQFPQLTASQSQAVQITKGNVCVSAGAGTGKTRVLVERFFHLISEKLAQPNEILAITFTEKAAQEMKKRIADRLRESGLEDARRQLEGAYIGTIHAFCARILREHPIEAGVDPDFRVLEEDEANLLKEIAFAELIETRFKEPNVFHLLNVYGEAILKEAIESVIRNAHTSGISLSGILAKEIREDINVSTVLSALKKIKGKDAEKSEIEQLLSQPITEWNRIESLKLAAKKFQRRGEEQKTFRDALDQWLAIVIEKNAAPIKSSFLDFAIDFQNRYQNEKRKVSGLDFDDLEREAVKLLNGNEIAQVAIRKLYQNHFKFIMVDEFQDTSPVQDRLIGLIEHNENLFIVGDWKQSIYGFRGADASLFMKKRDEFSNKGIFVSLIDNFRSRSELMNQMNPFFKQLWIEEEAMFEALHAKSEAQEKVIPSLEFLTIDRNEEMSVEETRIREAKALATRVKELTESNHYKFGDFAMLFRAADDIFFYEYELRNLGIPYYVVSGRGFYRQLEIRDIVSFLEILDNPYLNIPFAAVLRSPLVQVSDDALFWLANHSTRLKPQVPIYQALHKCEHISELSSEEREQLLNFRSLFQEMLTQKSKWSISELIEFILKRTRYNRYILSLPQGKRHYANLRKLLEVARQLERQKLHLGDFIRYIKGLETQEVRESEAQVEALEGNVVKLMTIHKAKGLEFKVVLIPDLARKSKSEKNYFLLDPELGLGFKVFNGITRDFEETYSYQKIKEKRSQNNYEESKRLLYVGMTRAKDHLIVSGTSKVKEKEEDFDATEKFNWYEWLDQWLPNDSNIIRKKIDSYSEKEVRAPLSPVEHKKVRMALESGEKLSTKTNKETEELIEFLKPITPIVFDRIDLPVSAFSVFENDPEEYRKVYEIGALPEEIAEIEEWTQEEDEEKINPAEFGTVIHKIFEYLVIDPERANQKLASLISRFTQDLDEQTKNEIKDFSVSFLKSKLFSEIKKAKARYAEIPFVFRLKGGMIQGTLDLLYQKADGAWVILDYKTSQVSEANLEEVANHYKTQLMFYVLACQELLKITVSQASLYFVRSDQVYDFSLGGIDISKLKDNFETIQKSIIQTRKAIVR